MVQEKVSYIKHQTIQNMEMHVMNTSKYIPVPTVL